MRAFARPQIRWQSITSLFFCLMVLMHCPSTQANSSNRPADRPIVIKNQSNKMLEVFWVNDFAIKNFKGRYRGSGEPDLRDCGNCYVPQVQGDALYPGAVQHLNSFVGHTFQVRQKCYYDFIDFGIPDEKDLDCRIGFFTVTPNDDQEMILSVENFDELSFKDLIVEVVDDITKMRREVEEISNKCKGSMSEERMFACLEDRFTEKFLAKSKELTFSDEIRRKMAPMIENYTCADHELPSTTPVKTETWKYLSEPPRNYDIFIDLPRSKIQYIHNFISTEECDAIVRKGTPSLHRATIADNKGGSVESPNRKANQSSIVVQWKSENTAKDTEDDKLVRRLSRRIFHFVNDQTNLNLTHGGQEDLMFIAYEGRGEDDPEPDRYMPHCDSDCKGEEFKPGNRVATVVMYCQVPEKGGATNFAQSNVHIVPEVGGASFFSYVGLDGIMDSQFTEHSGCPVITGQKKIVTMWLRKDVTDEVPWTSYNTLGVSKTAVSNMQKEEAKRKIAVEKMRKEKARAEGKTGGSVMESIKSYL